MPGNESGSSWCAWSGARACLSMYRRQDWQEAEEKCVMREMKELSASWQPCVCRKRMKKWKRNRQDDGLMQRMWWWWRRRRCR